MELWRLVSIFFILLVVGCAGPELGQYEELPRYAAGRAAIGPDGGIVSLGDEVEVWVPRGAVAAGGLLVGLEAVPLPVQTKDWNASSEQPVRGFAYRLRMDSTGALAAGESFPFLLRFYISISKLDYYYIFPYQEISNRILEIPIDNTFFSGNWLVLPGRLPLNDQAETVTGAIFYGADYCQANGGEWVRRSAAAGLTSGYCQAPWGKVWKNAPTNNKGHIFPVRDVADILYGPRFPELASSLGLVTANMGNLDLSVKGKAVDPYILQRVRNSLSYLQPALLALQEVADPGVTADLLSGGSYGFFCASSGYDCLAWKKENFNLMGISETIVGGLAPPGVESFMELPAGRNINEYVWCNGETGAAMVRLREVGGGREFAALSTHTATGLTAIPQIPCREQQLISFLRASGAAAWAGNGWRAGGGLSLWMGDFNIDPVRGSAPNFGFGAADARRLRWLADWSAQTGLPAEGVAPVSGLLALRSDNLPTHTTGRSYDHVLASRGLLGDWSCTVPPRAKEGRLEVGSGLADLWTLDAEGLRLWNEYLDAGGIDFSTISTPMSPDHRPVYCSLRFAPAP